MQYKLLNTQVLAAAGSARSDATPIGTKAPCLVHVTGADGAKGIKLPPASAGQMIIIKNDDAANSILKVYPASADDAINAITAGSSISMAAKTCAVFAAIDQTTWFTSPLLPS